MRGASLRVSMARNAANISRPPPMKPPVLRLSRPTVGAATTA